MSILTRTAYDVPGILSIDYRRGPLILRRTRMFDGERGAHFQVGLWFVADVERNEFGSKFRISLGFNRPSVTVKVLT